VHAFDGAAQTRQDPTIQASQIRPFLTKKLNSIKLFLKKTKRCKGYKEEK
jgi:hypothetical protein